MGVRGSSALGTNRGFEVGQTKRRKSMQRETGGRSTNGPKTPKPPSGGRRFSPSLKRVTEGGRIYGGLIAEERARLGLSQQELAARIRTSTATVERIEEGHPPGVELNKELSKALFAEPEGPIRRLASAVPMRRLPPLARATPGRGLRPPRLPHPSAPSRQIAGSRRFWGAVAIGVAVVLLAVVGTQLSSGDDAPTSDPLVQVSSAPGAPATIHFARVAAQKEAAAEARRAAREARERERAAAAAAAAAAARRAEKAAARQQSSSSVSPPAPTPVESSPTPSPSGGGGGSDSPPPEVQHGIGTGGLPGG